MVVTLVVNPVEEVMTSHVEGTYGFNNDLLTSDADNMVAVENLDTWLAHVPQIRKGKTVANVLTAIRKGT